MNAHQADEIVTELTEYRSIGCSDCDGVIDLRDADTEIDVVIALERHAREYHED